MILFTKFNQDFNIHSIAYDITRKGTESRNVRILTFLTHAGAFFHSPLCIKVEYFVYKGESKFVICFFLNREITLIRKSTFYCGVTRTYFLRREISLLNFRTLEIRGTETL